MENTLTLKDLKPEKTNIYSIQTENLNHLDNVTDIYIKGVRFRNGDRISIENHKFLVEHSSDKKVVLSLITKK